MISFIHTLVQIIDKLIEVIFLSNLTIKTDLRWYDMNILAWIRIPFQFDTKHVWIQWTTEVLISKYMIIWFKKYELWQSHIFYDFLYSKY